MADLSDRVNEAISAFKSGRKDAARDILLEVVDQDERNEEAWLWLSEMVDTLDEKQICLENVLAVNSSNARARQALERVNQQVLGGASSTSSGADASAGSGSVFTTEDIQFAAPQSTPPAQDRPLARSGSSAPIGAEFESVSGDALIDNPSAPGGDAMYGDAAGSTPDSLPADRDPGASGGFDWSPAAAPDDSSPAQESQPASSVDWGTESGATIYGSGRDVGLPSPQEYDDWVQGLNLDGTTPGASDGPGGEAPPADAGAGGASTAFDDTSFMMDTSFLDSQPGGSAAESAPAATDLGGDFNFDAGAFGADASPSESPASADEGPGLAFIGGNSPFEGFDAAFDAPAESSPAMDPPLFAESADPEPASDVSTASGGVFETGPAGEDVFSSAFSDSQDAFSVDTPEANADAAFGRDGLITEEPGGLYDVEGQAESPAFSLDDEDDMPFGDEMFAEDLGEDELSSRLNAYVSPGTPGAAAAVSPGGAGVAASSPGAPDAGYLRYIPDEIEAGASGGSRAMLLLGGVVLMLALNIASFGYLLTSL